MSVCECVTTEVCKPKCFQSPSPGKDGSGPDLSPGIWVSDSIKPVLLRILFLCSKRSLLATEPLLKEAFLIEKSCKLRSFKFQMQPDSLVSAVLLMRAKNTYGRLSMC